MKNTLKLLDYLRRIKHKIPIRLRYTAPVILACELLAIRRRLFRKKTPEPKTDLAILIIKLDHIGDLVMCSPMIRELRKYYQHSKITLLVSRACLDLARACPHVNEVIGIDIEAKGKRLPTIEVLRVIKFCKNMFASRSFDLTLIPRWDMDQNYATLISYYVGAPRRVWFTEECSSAKRLINRGFDRYYTDIIPPGILKHEVERNIDIVRYLGAKITSRSTELWLTQADIQFADQWWSENRLDYREIVVACAPGSNKEKCRWPESKFADLIDNLNAAYGERLRVILICSPTETRLGENIASRTKARVLRAKTGNVRHAAALIAKCSLLVGNNSGPIHLAAAATIPVVEVSCHPEDGDSDDELNPIRFGAFTKSTIVVQPKRAVSPCTSRCQSSQQHCIAAVQMNDVSDAVQKMIGARIANPNKIDAPIKR